MSPSDVEAFIGALSQHDIAYQEGGKARDLVVIDQLRGPLVLCDWAEFSYVNFDGDPTKRIATCRKTGSLSKQVVTPHGWTFESSLSSTYGFVPSDQQHKCLKFLRREGGLNVYMNELTCQEVFVGRTTQSM